MRNVAVVILNYNGADMLRRFLPGVIAFSGGAQVVVADNASTDDSVAVMRNEFPQVRLIVLDRNWGFADGYNRALEQVDAEIYVLLNSDVEVTEGWLVSMKAAMDADATVAACQPKLLDYKRKTYFEYAGAAGGFIDCYGYPFCRGRLFDTVEHDEGQYDTVADLFWATGAALMIRARDYWDAGGLDGRFFAHMEEIDLCWRLRSMGRRILCIPTSVVYHVGGATLNRSNPRKTYLNFRNNLLMLYKNLPQDELCGVMRARLMLDMLAAAKFLATGAWGDFKAVIAARRDYRRMRRSFLSDREECMRRAVSGTVPERVRFSLLWRYYVKGERLFSSLFR